MCGRFALEVPWSTVVELLEGRDDPHREVARPPAPPAKLDGAPPTAGRAGFAHCDDQSVYDVSTQG
ncbi:MAG: hypothetical protein ACI9MR_005264, partial [Myxococcota bacterium]